jgi:hypothetical protein
MTFVNTVFAGNQTSGRGGAIHIGNGSITRLINGVLVGNQSDDEGGALHANSGWFEAVNVTAAGNRAGAASQHAGAVLYSPGSSTLHNVVLWGNEGANVIGGSGTVEATRGIVEGGCTSLMTCDSVSNADPLFVRPPFADGPADYGDLRLRVGSPAIDAGLASLLPPDVWDLDEDGDTTEVLPIDILGQPRVQGLEVDLGAYEGGVVVAGEPAPTDQIRDRLTITPNPVTEAGVVTLTVRIAASDSRVTVHDVLGRAVGVLHAGSLPAGLTLLALPRLPVGLYVVRVIGVPESDPGQAGVAVSERFTVMR